MEIGDIRTRLSRQEFKVLQLTACAMQDKDIAFSLGTSMKTVAVQQSNLKKKLKARNRTHAALIYHGLAEPGELPEIVK